VSFILPLGYLSPQSIQDWRMLKPQHPREALVNPVPYRPIKFIYEMN